MKIIDRVLTSEPSGHLESPLPMLVTSKDVKSPTAHRILDNYMLVLGIAVLVDLVKGNDVAGLDGGGSPTGRHPRWLWESLVLLHRI